MYTFCMVEHFTLRKRHPIPALVLGIVSAACVVFARLGPVPVVVSLSSGMIFSYSDLFVIIAAGIGGFSSGMLSFVLIFLSELFRSNYDFSGLYAISTYMVLILLSARLSARRFFSSPIKTAFVSLFMTVVLALCWYVTFVFFYQADIRYGDMSFVQLLLNALPECTLSCFIVWAFFTFASDKVKLNFENGWLYTSKYVSANRKYNSRNSVLGRRIALMSLTEALLLCIVAIVFYDIQTTLAAGETFHVTLFFSLWRTNVQLALLFLSAALPIAYLFNIMFQHSVVEPINSMSFLMDRYYEGAEEKRVAALPDLHIHSGDEVEKIYGSLQKMVGDMSAYTERILRQEKKSAHLTQGFMIALAKTVDAKDHYTSGHSERVALYAKEIARRMGKSAREQENIYMMGILHDIGKIAVSEAIINKNGRLTEEEFAKIKGHPMAGFYILKNVTELPALATGARWHHERYDGKGYPDGLSGTNIPEEARIIAIADAYDAMTSKRAYSNIRSQAEVRTEIARCRGSQFDPDIADIFLGMIDDDKDYRMKEVV